jgi:hypothetical protein
MIKAWLHLAVVDEAMMWREFQRWLKFTCFDGRQNLSCDSLNSLSPKSVPAGEKLIATYSIST